MIPDFSDLIVDRTKDFIGREWVFAKIDRWLADPKGARVFLLIGGPGSGKMALAARLAQTSLGEVLASDYSRLGPGCLAFAHFCQVYDDPTLGRR